MVCKICFHFSHTRIGSFAFPKLQQSASSGCPYCSLLVRSLDALLHLSEIEKVQISNKRSGEWCLAVNVTLRAGYRPKIGPVFGKMSSGAQEVVQIFAHEGHGKPGDWVTTLYNVPDPCSEASFQFISESLRSCQETHDCSEMSGQLLPRRAVDVGTPSSPIRVVDYSSELGPYVALSHCWGDNKHVRLTSDTTSFFQNIPLEVLPATFSDAIEVTRRLNLNYVWIDSLCIIQDSAEDWEIECARMGDIYQNAELTIAATSSPSSSRSFLRPPEKMKQPRVQVPFWNKDGKEFALQAVRPLSYHFDNVDSTEGYLNKRAWCFQEDMLSKRLVSYQNIDIKWRCSEGHMCQCVGPSVKRSDSATSVRTLRDEPEEESVNTWLQAVNDFSDRDITFVSDRLPALAGIATVFHESFSWTYVAGLWKEWLLHCLCWKSDYRDPILPDRLQPLAPSFSWASSQSSVLYDRAGMYLEPVQVPTKVLAVSSTLKGEKNPFGEVTGGYIEVEGPLIEARLRCSDTSSYHDYFVDCEPLGEWKFCPDTHLARRTVGGVAVAARCSVGKVEKLEDVRVWILCLALNFSDINDYTIDAIALRPLEGNLDHFERIGFLEDGGPQFILDHQWWVDPSQNSAPPGDLDSPRPNNAVQGDEDTSDTSEGYDSQADDNGIQDDSQLSQEDEIISELSEGNSADDDNGDLSEATEDGDVPKKRDHYPPGKPLTIGGRTYHPYKAWKILTSDVEPRRIRIV
ncbi:HET-domain-containing protein [Lophium mytilinum]|uniref:HET-domain-containing protein n=1 Tax=Lophium mytilinum TaxID=390894 RepID=A0A6A6QSK4_9PEZI|nr:HET-domain-containing protein [Lophium mytilinum]